MNNPVTAFLNRNKMELAILLGVTATAALKYKSIYVPECIENPSDYKKSIVSFGLFQLAVGRLFSETLLLFLDLNNDSSRI